MLFSRHNKLLNLSSLGIVTMLRTNIINFMNQWPKEFLRLKAEEKVIKEFNRGKAAKDKMHRSDDNSQVIQIIKKDICDDLRNIINKPNKYTIEGSVGQGNIADIPWVCIYDNMITKGAANGYYIVYLFRPELKKVYLSLVFGWTQFLKGKTVPKKIAISDIKEKVYAAQKLIDNVNPFSTRPISLSSKSGLAAGYEAGTICNIEYKLDSLPNNEELIENIEDMLFLYKELKKLIGNSVFEIEGILPEDDYQNSSQDEKEVPKTPKGKICRKDPLGDTNNKCKKWPRDKIYAIEAKQNADYKCEYDISHSTFIHKKSKKQFVEAHHLIPMQYQECYEMSIDVPENIISLCPTCHRAFHSSDNLYRKKLIDAFYQKRKDLLINDREIEINIENLYKYYGV